MKPASLRFEGFTLDLARLQLRGLSGQVSLRPKAFEVLRYLTENAGRVVTKHEMMTAVWSGATVSDESLTHCISEVRGALGDKDRRMVKTAPRRGYLFNVPVAVEDHAEELATAEEPAPSPVTERPSIAVLPFVNMTADPQQDHLADGIVEDIITALSRFRGLHVIARNSSFVFKGRAVDVREVARELGVRYMLEGSVRRAGDRLRITGQLIDAETAAHLWADRYDGEMPDVFDLQDRITRRVVAAIEPRVLGAEIARATRKGTAKLDAYDYCLRARHNAMKRTRHGLDEALKLLRSAVEADPAYAQAWIMLALCSVTRFFLGDLDRDAVAPDAVRFARTAIACDRDDAEVLAIAAYMLSWNGEHGEAVELAHAAIALNGHSSTVCTGCGWALVYAGLFDEAIAMFQEARVLDPLSARDTSVIVGMAVGNFFLRRFSEAAAWAKRARAKSPEVTSALRYELAALAQAGQLAEARGVVDTLLAQQPGSSVTRSQQGNSFRHAWMLDLYIEGLRLAGLPD